MIKKLKQKIYSLLIRSQKWTKTDMVYIAKGGFWLTLGKTISDSMSLVVSIFFAYYISRETYGNYHFILTVMGMLSIFSLPGMHTSLVQSIARGKEGSVKKAFWKKIKWGILGLIGGLAIAIYYYLQQNIILATAFVIISPFIPIFYGLEIYLSILSGRKEFKKMAIFQIWSQFISSLVIIPIIIFTKNIIILLLAHIFLQITIKIFFLINIKNNKPLNKFEEEETVNKGWHLSASGFFNAIISKLDEILIFTYLGPINLAIYTFASIPINKMTLALKNFRTMSISKISQRDPKTLKKTLPVKTIKATLVLTLIAALYYFSAPYLYKLIYPKYTASIFYSQILFISIIFFPKFLMGQAITSHGNNKKIYIANLVPSISRLVLLIILLPIYGIWGAIFAFLGMEIINLISIIIIFKKL